MIYRLAVRKSVDKAFSILAKRNPVLMKNIEKKIKKILVDPHHFKTLRAPLKHLRRVHVNGSHVLVFSIDEENELVIIEDYAHHDDIYRIR